MIDTEWVKLPLSKTAEDMVIRVANRALVGLPMCAQALFIFFGVSALSYS